ncbi:tRNA glutamyl-Q(34) synthetase GluQRS [Acidipila sp. 4G-K13]|uniref:tRNA glutamyl-Q(34) synthetase GluQRS n=1 Tax=Paracidobacterium acidisoli TaxID=2303751 RepID=A0A372IQ13_9BACT|nr:tRNA glutamyl-Q(34) synthetase GluQRS [Paracidobacterium acidisoli]
MNPSYRGRIAPTPTGLLHLGHARTFFTAFCRARDAGGTLILRNEDLDPQRCRPEFTDAMYEDLRWLGISWQEGPDIHTDIGGPFAPYTQSRRRGHYLRAWRALRDQGVIYPCTCSRKDLSRIAQAPHEGAGESDEGPMYPGSCRPAAGTVADAAQYPEPAGVNWRFQVPDGESIGFEDAHFGPQRFLAGRDFGDFLVWRRDDVPAYQLAVVVDDAAMQITEVVRGADLLLSTVRQILLYRALGLEPPLWYHCPLLRDQSGQRLAKRHDALSIRSLREQGKSPQELLAEAR